MKTAAIGVLSLSLTGLFVSAELVKGGDSQGIIVRASHCWRGNTTDVLFDGKLPTASTTGAPC